MRFTFLLDIVKYLWLYTTTLLWEVVYLLLRNRPKKDIKNAHILITGSGQGLGKELATKLANNGNTLHLVDINSETNDKNIEDFAANDCTVLTYHCDVSKFDAIMEMHKKVKENSPKIDYLFNNAGIIHGKLFTETSIEEMDLTMNVNIMGVMHITKVFLDDMIEKGGHIILISSVGGHIGGPYGIDYCTSKHAVTGFGRALLYDLEYLGIKHVKITTIYPNTFNTALVTEAPVEFPLGIPAIFALMDPVWVADQIITATREERNDLFLPRAINYFIMLKHLMPSEMFRQFGRLVGNDQMKMLGSTGKN